MALVKSALQMPKGDHCLQFFQILYEAGRIPMPEGARVLEVGSAEADWLTPMKRARPDLYLVGLDQRVPNVPRPGVDAFVLGNVLDPTLFREQTFDVIVAVSTIEHVGLGAYKDPLDPDGDTHAMANLHRWLKPDGLCYLDVPYRQMAPPGPWRQFRPYDDTTLQSRLLAGWQVTDREVFVVRHEDSPYIALVLRPV